ncbi:MAG: hypothetical protein IKM79_03115 [Bacteroidales bacterium]|nr:hypothetical protein [Bacteroidales bacterium]
MRENTGRKRIFSGKGCEKNKKDFASFEKVCNFALSKNGEDASCIPVQVALFQVDKHVGQLSVGGRNAMQSAEKLKEKRKNIIVSKIKK